MKAVLLLGSNLGDSIAILDRSVALLDERCGSVLKRTEVLQNKAWGYESEHDFFNMIVILETHLDPLTLLDEIEAIERFLGRKKEPCDWRSDRVYEDRLIDIDILTCNVDGSPLEFDNARLKIPHPRMGERDFVKTLLSAL